LHGVQLGTGLLHVAIARIDTFRLIEQAIGSGIVVAGDGRAGLRHAHRRLSGAGRSLRVTQVAPQRHQTSAIDALG
jgi:hypothetical protein